MLDKEIIKNLLPGLYKITFTNGEIALGMIANAPHSPLRKRYDATTSLSWCFYGNDIAMNTWDNVLFVKPLYLELIPKKRT